VSLPHFTALPEGRQKRKRNRRLLANASKQLWIASLGAANRREFVHRDGCQLAIGHFEQDDVAGNAVIVGTMEMQSMAATFGANHGAAALGRPTILPNGNTMLDFDTIAGLQFVNLRPDIVVTGSGGHGTE
jgi:hypothetical protein